MQCHTERNDSAEFIDHYRIHSQQWRTFRHLEYFSHISIGILDTHHHFVFHHMHCILPLKKLIQRAFREVVFQHFGETRCGKKRYHMLFERITHITQSFKPDQRLILVDSQILGSLGINHRSILSTLVRTTLPKSSC